MAEISPKTIEAIKTAIRLEEEGYQYYQDAAANTENEMGRKMFDQLARDEIEHLRIFQEMFDQLADPVTWRKLAQDTPGVPIIPKFKDLSKDKKKSASLTADANALKIALENEEKAYNFFIKAAKEADDEKASDIFTKIAEQEDYHWKLLQAELDSVMNTGFWFDTAEFRMDGKF